MFSRIFVFILFVFSSLNLVAQPPQTERDSLQNQLQLLSQQKPSLQRDSLIIKCLASIFMGFPSKEIALREFYNDSLSRFAPKTSWKKALGYQKYISGFMHTFKGENTLAFNDIEKALLEFKKHRDEEYYENSVERLSILMSRNMMVKPITNPILQRKYLKYITERLEETKVKFNQTKLAGSYASLGQYYLMLKDYQRSIQFYEEEVKTAHLNIKPDNYFYEYHSGLFFSKGLCPLYLNPENKEALKAAEKIVEICQTQKHNNYENYLLLVIIHYLGNFYCEQGKFKEALKLGLIGQNIKEFPQMPFYYYLVNNVLEKAYKGLNQPSKAFYYLEKVNEYQEKSGAEELRSNLSEWQLKYEDEKQINQIKTLEYEKLQAQANRDTWIRNLLILSLLIGSIFLIYTNRTNKKLREKNREIEEAMLKGQVIERKRVAEELHDNLSAKISGIRIRLEAIEPDFRAERHRQIYESSVNALAEVYTDVRLISHNLLPAELEIKGLAFAVENLVKELNSLEKTKFSLEINQNLGRFSNKIEYEIFSIILELSNNILKHSEAENASISLRKELNSLNLKVEDNGIGFDLANHKKGMGMGNLKSRVDSLRGHLEISNQNGVCVEITIPLAS